MCNGLCLPESGAEQRLYLITAVYYIADTCTFDIEDLNYNLHDVLCLFL